MEILKKNMQNRLNFIKIVYYNYKLYKIGCFFTFLIFFILMKKDTKMK